MSNIGAKLRIKYKLLTVPSDDEARAWAALVERYRGDGMEAEEAGHKAADLLFEIVDNLVLKSEADTIKSLLDQARRK